MGHADINTTMHYMHLTGDLEKLMRKNNPMAVYEAWKKERYKKMLKCPVQNCIQLKGKDKGRPMFFKQLKLLNLHIKRRAKKCKKHGLQLKKKRK